MLNDVKIKKTETLLLLRSREFMREKDISSSTKSIVQKTNPFAIDIELVAVIILYYVLLC